MNQQDIFHGAHGGLIGTNLMLQMWVHFSINLVKVEKFYLGQKLKQPAFCNGEYNKKNPVKFGEKEY